MGRSQLPILLFCCGIFSAQFLLECQGAEVVMLSNQINKKDSKADNPEAIVAVSGISPPLIDKAINLFAEKAGPSPIYSKVSPGSNSHDAAPPPQLWPFSGLFMDKGPWKALSRPGGTSALESISKPNVPSTTSLLANSNSANKPNAASSFLKPPSSSAISSPGSAASNLLALPSQLRPPASSSSSNTPTQSNKPQSSSSSNPSQSKPPSSSTSSTPSQSKPPSSSSNTTPTQSKPTSSSSSSKPKPQSNNPSSPSQPSSPSTVLTASGASANGSTTETSSFTPTKPFKPAQTTLPNPGSANWNHFSQGSPNNAGSQQLSMNLMQNLANLTSTDNVNINVSTAESSGNKGNSLLNSVSNEGLFATSAGNAAFANMENSKPKDEGKHTTISHHHIVQV